MNEQEENLDQSRALLSVVYDDQSDQSSTDSVVVIQSSDQTSNSDLAAATSEPNISDNHDDCSSQNQTMSDQTSTSLVSNGLVSNQPNGYVLMVRNQSPCRIQSSDQSCDQSKLRTISLSNISLINHSILT